MFYSVALASKYSEALVLPEHGLSLSWLSVYGDPGTAHFTLGSLGIVFWPSSDGGKRWNLFLGGGHRQIQKVSF